MPCSGTKNADIFRRYWNFRAFFYRIIRYFPLTAPIVRCEEASFRRMMQSRSLNKPGGVILNLGCGERTPPLPGTFELRIGLDWSAGMLVRSKNKPEGWRFVCGDSRTLPFRDSSIDTVTTLGLTEYIEDAEGWLLEIKRVLKPGGALFFTAAHPSLPNYIRKLWSPGLKFRRPVQWRKIFAEGDWEEVDFKQLLLQSQFLLRKTN